MLVLHLLIIVLIPKVCIPCSNKIRFAMVSTWEQGGRIRTDVAS